MTEIDIPWGVQFPVGDPRRASLEHPVNQETTLTHLSWINNKEKGINDGIDIPFFETPAKKEIFIKKLFRKKR